MGARPGYGPAKEQQEQRERLFMRHISLGLCVGSMLLFCGAAQAQCTGSGSGSGTTTASSIRGGNLSGGGISTGAGARLLTGPGSWAYDQALSGMLQRQLVQRQYELALRQQAQRQQDLAARRYRAEKRRAIVAESRRQTRASLANKSSTPSAVQSTSYLAANSSNR
jgi:hypothetical protein